MTDQFVGTPALKAKHAAQIGQFETWAAARNWSYFHDSHFDWWAFPVDSSSSAYGDRYHLTPQAIQELKANRDFMRLHRRGLQLAALAWGWDIDNARYVVDPAQGQSWSRWPVRLNKMARSARLFGHADYFESLRTFATHLKHANESFAYGSWDMFKVFLK